MFEPFCAKRNESNIGSPEALPHTPGAFATTMDTADSDLSESLRPEVVWFGTGGWPGAKRGL